MDARDEYRRIIEGLRDNIELLIASGITNLPAHRSKGSPEDTEASGLKERVLGCAVCGAEKSAKKVAMGTGSRGARLVFVGGAPAEEDAIKGEPFTGQAGELLTRMIEAMGLKRKDVYILNSVRCASTGEPSADEVASCRKFLEEELKNLSPRVIVALGSTAALSLLGDSDIVGLRGRFNEYRGIKVMSTYGTSELIKNPALKKAAWEDLKLVVRELEGG